ncbi:putative F-box protein At3g16210 [Daucus carota subsp. sativus]|uniref:putative F-box protein At3g16210 n=1 Tax=Daucus carota subsp. sativus TaxID=79200 RepID=UPI003083B919
MARRENCKKNNSELPHELMFKIFFLLPVATLLRCKSVCKTWLSIISDPQFVEAHCIESQKRQPSSVTELSSDQICIDNHESKTLLQLSIFYDGIIHFLSCCNGLVCFANTAYSTIFLGNPMTRQFKKVPTPQKQTAGSFSIGCKLGFGFDDVSQDYKIIRFVCDHKDSSYSIEAEMYSANEDSWKEIRVPIGLETTFQFVRHRRGCVFRPDQSRVLYFEGFREVLSFDLHDEVFRLHPYPRPTKLPLPGVPKSYLLEFEGSVAMICDESSGDGETVHSLWTLERDCGNWIKQFKLEDCIKNDHIILYLGDGQFVVNGLSYYRRRSRSIYYYYNRKNAKEYLGASPARQVISVVKFNESLVSIKGFKQLEDGVFTADSII